MDRRIERKIDFMISSRKKSYPSGIFQPYQWIPKNQKMDILPANLFQPVVNISWGHMSCHKKIGPIGFGRFRGLLENLLNFFLLSMGPQWGLKTPCKVLTDSRGGLSHPPRHCIRLWPCLLWSDTDVRTNRCDTVVSDYINIMKTTFLFKFWLLTSFFRSLQVIKEKLF